MKIEKSVGLILIILLLFSSVAFTTYYAFKPRELPKEKILKEIGKEEEYLILNEGFTLINYYYDEDCEKCMRIKNYLEDLVQTQQFKEIYLNLIKTDTSYPIAIIANLYNVTKIENFDEKDITQKICEIMIEPPIECLIE